MSVSDNLRNLAWRTKYWVTRTLPRELGNRFAPYWIIVFQMGKVGSMTVYRSLKERMRFIPVFHIHMLSEKQALRMQGLIERGIEVRRHKNLVEHAEQMRQKLTDQHGARKKIISLVREPVDHLIATTMSEYRDRNPQVFENSGYFQPEHRAALHQLFLERSDFDYDFVAPWFDTEIRDLFGIDVFEKPFPSEQGYAIYRAKYADLLLIRMEDLNRCSRDAIANFLRLPGFELVNTNRAEDKGPAYSQVYAEFKKTVALPDDLLDKLYSIPWAKHFYSEDEITSFRSRWENRK